MKITLDVILQPDREDQVSVLVLQESQHKRTGRHLPCTTPNISPDLQGGTGSLEFISLEETLLHLSPASFPTGTTLF